MENKEPTAGKTAPICKVVLTPLNKDLGDEIVVDLRQVVAVHQLSPKLQSLYKTNVGAVLFFKNAATIAVTMEYRPLVELYMEVI